MQSRTAPEVDVYRWEDGRVRPLGAQIKTHASSDPATYARDMVRDRKANLFLVPDDHVEGLRDHWRNKIREYERRGLARNSADARSQLRRIGGLGFTSMELDTNLSRAAQHVWRERSSSYVSFGVASAVALGPVLWDFLQGNMQTDEFAYHAARAGSVIAAERLSSQVLKNWKTGALRGTWRGNALVGTSLLVVDTMFVVYENGGLAAFHSADFYAQLGGSLSASAVGLKVGAATARVAAKLPHRERAALAIVAGLVSGSAAYVGGQTLSLEILEMLDPDFLHKQERLAVDTARENLKGRIRLLQGETIRL